MDFGGQQVAFEGTLRRTIAHEAPIMDLGGQQVAFEGTLRRTIAHEAPIMDLGGQQVAVERVFGAESQIACVALEVAAVL